MAKENKAFITITNKDIYAELRSLIDSIDDFKKINQEQHTQIIVQTTKTNGTVKSHTLLIGWLWGFLITTLGWFIIHLIKG